MLSAIPDLTLDTSEGALVDSIRQISKLQVRCILMHKPFLILTWDHQPDMLRREVLHAFAKSISMIWIVETPIVGFCLLLGTFETSSTQVSPDKILFKPQ